MELSLVILAIAAILNNGVNARRVPRIVAGGRVEIENAPYTVMLRDYRAGDSIDGHICGGSIISNRYILTAAHCINEGDGEPLDLDELDNLVIVAGEEIYGYDASLYEVEEIYHPTTFHGDLSDTSKDRGDIAIIKLAEEIIFNSRQQSIELAEHEPEAKAQGLIYGWGRTSRNSPYSRTLQGLKLEYYSVAACAYVFPFVPFTKDELCAKSAHNSDSCSGDSGGPFVINHKLAGVISHGSTGCDGARPNAFASVPYYKSWIEDVMKGNVKPIYPPVNTESSSESPYPYLCPPQNAANTEGRRHRFAFEKRRRNKLPAPTPVPMYM